MENNKKKSKTAQMMEPDNLFAGRSKNDNYNALVLGHSGGGKSFFVKRKIFLTRLRYPKNQNYLVIGRAGSGKVFRYTKPYTTADPSDGSYCLRSTCHGVPTNL